MSRPGRPHPREDPERCSVRAAERGDPMLGTAFPAGRLLLIEQPGAWGRAGLRESDLDPTVAGALERRAGAEGIRVLAVRTPGRHRPVPPGTPRRWILADCRDGVESIRHGQFHADEQLLELPLDGHTGRPDPGPLFLVCTHGKHDACCALRGRPVAAALHEQRPGRVLECSHVGGDRFAANVLVLPAGLLYGQVLAPSAAEFVAAAEADEVIGGLLRGRIGVEPTAQAALAFGYEHLAIRARRALRAGAASPVVDGRARVVLTGPHGALAVTVAVERVAADGLTCANPRPNRFLRYRPIAITALDPR